MSERTDIVVPDTWLPAAPDSSSLRTEMGVKAQSDCSGSSPWASR